MKKIVVTSILFLMVLVGAASCDKDEDSETANTGAALEGKWQFSQDGDLINNKEVLTDYVHLAGCSKDYVEFVKNGVYKTYFYDNPNCTLETYTATWIKNNNTFVLKSPNEPDETFEILQLTSTTLKIKYVDVGYTYITVFTRI